MNILLLVFDHNVSQSLPNPEFGLILCKKVIFLKGEKHFHSCFLVFSYHVSIL